MAKQEMTLSSINYRLKSKGVKLYVIRDGKKVKIPKASFRQMFKKSLKSDPFTWIPAFPENGHVVLGEREVKRDYMPH